MPSRQEIAACSANILRKNNFIVRKVIYHDITGILCPCRRRLQRHLSRLPSEALIKKFVLKYPGDPSFEQLRAALDAQDWELAFRASHTLKGVAQNLGMDRLYKAAAALCDAVRGPKPLEDASLWPPVLAAHEEVLAAVREL